MTRDLGQPVPAGLGYVGRSGLGLTRNLLGRAGLAAVRHRAGDLEILVEDRLDIEREAERLPARRL